MTRGALLTVRQHPTKAIDLQVSYTLAEESIQ